MEHAVAAGRATRAAQKETTERALLDAAAEVIAERGIAGASFSTISERAGTSRTLPTHHFGAKDELVSRVIDRAHGQFGHAMTAAVERHHGTTAPTGIELICLLVDTYLELFEHPTPNERALLVLWGASFPSRSTLEGVTDADRVAFQGWAGHIRDGQTDGSIRHDVDPENAAVILHGMLRGLAAFAITGVGLHTPTAIRRSVHDWIATALSQP